MAEHQHNCAHCNAQLPKDKHQHRKYCDSKCAKAAQVLMRHKAQPLCKCLNCAATFRPKEAGRTKFCGRACSYDFMKRRARLIKSMTFSAKVKMKGSAAKHRAQKVYYQPIYDAECRNCGNAFDRRDDGATRYMCSKACATEAVARVKRIGRKSRKAKERGARTVESIDPIKVFERDGWRCGICGCKTHKAKRGLYHPRSPELDHIVALANGGTHTWRNVQCSCRECNGRKGATDYGQIPLFPAA